jgi:predicted transposase/invertase (TIGR01784 family)
MAMTRPKPASDKSILSPKSDLIFKRIFGIQKNIDILASFLKSVLDLPEAEYESLTIVNPYSQIETPLDKYCILDIKLNTRSGKIIDIEIQILDPGEMPERIVYYLARMITEQISKNEDYFSLKKVISILITDFRLVKDTEAYHNRYHLYDSKTGSKFSDIIEVNTLELPKLPGKSDDTGLWDWLKFLKADQKEELDMVSKNNPQIEKAADILVELSEDEQTRLLFEARQKARWDEVARIRKATREGEEKGEEKKQKEVIRNALQENMPIDLIAKITDSSLEEVKAVAAELQAQLN